MFSVEDIRFATYLYMYYRDSLIKIFPRSGMNEDALEFGIQDPEKVKNKKQLIEAILYEWGNYFRAHPEFKKAYEEKWEFGFSLDQVEKQ